MTYLLVDLETSSRFPNSAEILTADFIHLDSDLNEVESIGFKFRPRIWRKEADDATLIHGITRDEAYQFPTYHNSIRDMFKYLLSFNKAHLVSHSNRMHRVSYDQAIIRFHALDNGYYFDMAHSLPESKYISTHSLAKFLNVPGKLDLKSICKYFNIEQKQHHSSSDDVKVTAELFKILMKDIDLEEFYRFENKQEILNEDTGTVPGAETRKRPQSILENN